jgi:hypothetical protein
VIYSKKSDVGTLTADLKILGELAQQGVKFFFYCRELAPNFLWPTASSFVIGSSNLDTAVSVIHADMPLRAAQELGEANGQPISMRRGKILCPLITNSGWLAIMQQFFRMLLVPFALF